MRRLLLGGDIATGEAAPLPGLLVLAAGPVGFFEALPEEPVLEPPGALAGGELLALAACLVGFFEPLPEEAGTEART
jgi:hypothetical protein